MNQSLVIFKKLGQLEKELQQLKIEAYLTLPKKLRPKSLYPEKTILRAVRDTRDALWRKRYAKKVARVS